MVLKSTPTGELKLPSWGERERQRGKKGGRGKGREGGILKFCGVSPKLISHRIPNNTLLRAWHLLKKTQMEQEM